jgi:predicted GNAT superfamily acetyltransferase
MSFEYIEIKDKLFVPDCVHIHKKIFHLTEAEAFPSFFFNMIIRNDHPLGIIIGCFKKENNKMELIGLTVTIADLQSNSIYCVLVGVLEEYQNGRHGYMFSQKLREVALEKGLSKMYGIYDPLEANLGKLYAFIGGFTSRYIDESFAIGNNQTGIDKVLFEWQFENNKNKKPLQKILNRKLEQLLIESEVVDHTESTSPEILIEIPTNFSAIKTDNPEKAEEWRLFIRKVFTQYLNHKGYIIIDCLSGNINGSKKTFYLLSNKTKNELFCTTFSIN